MRNPLLEATLTPITPSHWVNIKTLDVDLSQLTDSDFYKIVAWIDAETDRRRRTRENSNTSGDF